MASTGLEWEAGRPSQPDEIAVSRVSITICQLLIPVGAACLLLAPVASESAQLYSTGGATQTSKVTRITLASACWVVPGQTVLATPAVRRPPRKAQSKHIVRRPIHRAKPHQRRARTVTRAPVMAPTPTVQCDFFEPPPAGIEPFAEGFARLMEPVAANDSLTQKLVQKRQRRPRRVRAEPLVSAAPEPAAWLMLLTGFGVIGFALRVRSSKRLLRGTA